MKTDGEMGGFFHDRRLAKAVRDLLLHLTGEWVEIEFLDSGGYQLWRFTGSEWVEA